MQGRVLEQYLASRMSRTPSSLDQIGRALRAAKMLPSGARGLAAPHLQSKHVVNFLIAAALCRTAAEAPEIVKAYAGLVIKVGQPINEAWTLSPPEPIAPDGEIVTFRAALVALLEGRGGKRGPGSVRLQRWPSYKGLMTAEAHCAYGEFRHRNRIDMTIPDYREARFVAGREVAFEEVHLGDKLMTGVAMLLRDLPANSAEVE